MGVLKAIEEAGLKPQIDAVYGVSVGAILASYWTSGWSAQNIWERFRNLPLATIKWLTRNPTKYLLETSIFEEYFEKDLKSSFEELEVPTVIGATDILTGNFILFDKGELKSPLLGSMALPGIFPSVSHQEYLLNDGGIVNNFPIKEAKTAYPEHQLIGIALSKFTTTLEPKSLISTLVNSYSIMINTFFVPQEITVEHLFYEDIECGIIELNKQKWEQAFEHGYATGKKRFLAKER